MKNNIKKIIILSLSLMLITGCGCQKKEENITLNNPVDTEYDGIVRNTNSEEVVKDQVFDGLEFTNTTLSHVDGISTFMTEVTNNTGVDYELKNFNIIVKDKNGEEMASLFGYVTDNIIKNGETKVISSSITRNLLKAASIEYTVNK